MSLPAASLRREAVQVGFIGTGRLGMTLAHSMAQCGLSVAMVANRSPEAARQLAQSIAGCKSGTPQQVAAGCELIFITTVDGAIAATADALQWRAGSAVVHCSGVTEVSVLAKAAQDGALTGGFHPLQSFGTVEAAMRSLPGCTITIEAPAPLDALLSQIALKLQCRVTQLPPGARGRYHASAGYASQFVNVLLREASQIWQSWGASEEDAVAALLPLVRGTLASIESAGLAGGMPGPVSRGDIDSVARHVAALSALDPALLRMYQALCTKSIALGLECGGIDAAQAARLRTLLEG